MTSDRSKATNEAIQAAEGGMTASVLERLADLVGGRATVQAVFGEPIERGNLTVIPVARIRWGIGGGGGSTVDPTGGTESGSGTGGGGGVTADPVGYLEIRAEGAVFQPIRPPYPSPVLVMAAGFATAVVLRALIRGIHR